jgi:hypothetical protein
MIENRLLDDRDVREEEEPRSTADLINRSSEANRPNAPAPDEKISLFAGDEAENFHSRWHNIQGGFVDEPRRAVEQADQLVASVIQRLTEVFAEERNKMEHEWSKGQDVSTEDLRQALRRYRSFFDRLLSV